MNDMDDRNIEARPVMCLAVIYNGFQAYLVKSDIYQSDHDIEITEAQYDYLLDVNNNQQGEIRVIELEDGTLAVKDFYNPRPSLDHVWHQKSQTWVISTEDQERLQIAQNTAWLSEETQRTNTAIAMLDDAVEFEIATADEIAHHIALRKYRVLLSRVPNQATWPLNPDWPECPAFFNTKESL